MVASQLNDNDNDNDSNSNSSLESLKTKDPVLTNTNLLNEMLAEVKPKSIYEVYKEMKQNHFKKI